MQTVLLPVDLIGQVSDRALILYALMADRAKSSATRPQFIDSDGVPFVIFTVDEVQRIFNIGQCQARAAIKELEVAGLITGKCQGMGKPKKIYVTAVKTAEKSAVKTAEKSAVKTAEKSAVKTAEKSAPNQLDHNQSNSNQSSDDDIIEQIVDNYRKLPQFANITPDIADFVAKNVKNASKKRKIANIKAYIRTCLVSAPTDYAARLATTTDSGYPATYDIAAYESISAADSEVLDEDEREGVK